MKTAPAHACSQFPTSRINATKIIDDRKNVRDLIKPTRSHDPLSLDEQTDWEDPTNSDPLQWPTDLFYTYVLFQKQNVVATWYNTSYKLLKSN